MASGIEIRDTDGRGRSTFATRRFGAGEVLMRAIPAATSVNDELALTHCCVCLSDAHGRSPCDRCGAAVLCASCFSGSSGAMRLHADECEALARLAVAPDADRPKLARLRI